MSFLTSNNRYVIEFFPEGVNGRPAVIGCLLQFSVRYKMPSKDEQNAICRNLFGEVELNNQYLGRANLEVPKSFIQTEYEQNQGILFEILLAPQQLEAIEKIRQGEGVEFKLDIKGELEDKQNTLPRNQEIRFIVNQRGWIDILKQVGYGDYILFELPVYLDGQEHLLSAYNEINEAKRQLYYGHYYQVVSHCRTALEKLLQNDDKISELRKQYADFSKKKKMLKEQRFILFRDALNHITHLAHHMASDGSITSFSREEAIMVLGATAAVYSSEGLKQKISE
ncbi:MAG: hypothetical protein AB2731_07930 [Candidatus Thiodiazotropha sp.]